MDLAVDDYVFLRPTQSEHVMLQFGDLLVVDGSMIGANLGVNPSLTITALAERAMSFVPDKSA